MGNGLLIPPHYSPGELLDSPRFALNAALLQQPGAVTPDFGEQVTDILAFLAGTWRSAEGVSMTAVPGAGADAEVWILGSSGGQSARVAGARGLPFGANYHVSPSTVLEAAESYRSAFRPSPALSRPHVMVSADVVVAQTDAQARELAAPYGMWGAVGPVGGRRDGVPVAGLGRLRAMDGAGRGAGRGPGGDAVRGVAGDGRQVAAHPGRRDRRG